MSRFIENKKNLSKNNHQILLLNNSSVITVKAVLNKFLWED